MYPFILLMSCFHLLHLYAQDFLPCLKDHLLSQMLDCSFTTDEWQFTPADHCHIQIEKDCMFFHKVLQVNYIAYNMQWSQDSINLQTHPDIMLLTHEDEDDSTGERHPYWYA